MQRDSDEALFSRLIGGEKTCLRPLMERHGDACVLYIYGYVQNMQDAEDLMIETFSRMLARHPHLRPNGFKSYLYKAARNLALQHLRRKSHFMSLNKLTDEHTSEANPEDQLLQDEQTRKLYHALDSIAPDYREALFLVYIEGLSYDEAGAVMRKSRKQIDHLVYRGKHAMKELLKEDGS